MDEGSSSAVGLNKGWDDTITAATRDWEQTGRHGVVRSLNEARVDMTLFGSRAEGRGADKTGRVRGWFQGVFDRGSEDEPERSVNRLAGM